MALKDLFGKRTQTAAQQLLEWQVLAQVIGSLLQPALREVARAVNAVAQTEVLTPAQLADMVVRSIVAYGDAEAYAKQSGISPSDFQRMVHSAGEAPSPQEAIAMLRRGLIQRAGRGPDSTSFEQIIAEGRTFNKYTDLIEALGDVPLSPAEAADAAVENQIDYATAERNAYLNGVSAEHFKVMVDTRGRPPSPVELNVLYRRGLIPLEGTGPDAISVQQGIFEGATKDKWWRLFADLSDYVPPPRTVTAMIREGALTDAQGWTLYKHAGLTDELASAYLTSAHHQKTQTQRDLTVTQTGELYRDGLIEKATAEQILAAHQYSSPDQAYILAVWDFQVTQTTIRASVSRVHNLYVNHKIDAVAASTALDSLHVPASGRDRMLTAWNVERDVNVPHLTRAEIVDAWYYQVLETPEADRLLGVLGWSPEEAAILRGIRAHGRQRPTPRP